MARNTPPNTSSPVRPRPGARSPKNIASTSASTILRELGGLQVEDAEGNPAPGSAALDPKTSTYTSRPRSAAYIKSESLASTR